ncbi:cell-cycle control medial ring component [Ampelomyces quisqualis]|uniref:Cell-cycle control medial ring component n=1 Tax=Ampelomyces quisqualis TaxID=50730 RepID=A0A6A5QJ45_AMPQU|nr:cell-cycle control medial ring component [Ampelomyces quisqualis]
MAELAFCKTFLTALDARPAKLSSDHIADARQFPAQGAYTLPRLAHPPHPPRPAPKSAHNASSSSLSISLKPMKPSHPTIPVPGIDASTTSVYDLKTQYAAQASISATKIKILYKKKPVPDSKTVAEVIGHDVTGHVEFGVMIMAGATASPVTSPPAAAPSEADKGLAAPSSDGGPAAQGPSGKDVVATDQFWRDLKNFILQRTRDEAEAERLAKIFRGAWESGK